MKRKVSIILFGISFLVAILGEMYLLNASSPHYFSILGIGIVVILTGYLFFDSIWECITSISKRKELLWEEMLRQDSEKWDSRFTELLNIQKASYTAIKKSDKRLQDQIDELSDRLTEIMDLQNKLMEGQIKSQANENNNTKKVEEEIIPIYDDPNATLSEDENSRLFESYGR
ncbi:MAG: multidrug resistance efflux transporter family protein [Clostridiales bacterium]|jgi:hypothetical protein|nr:multidrug resistance efflux transporter family protein [Clostridiales bacterium]